jgi:acetyl-CoA C-acetyltransferase
LTVTGGLPYHGGAGSDYLTHAIATMTETLRADPGSRGLVSGVGMHMTKHVYGVYSTEPGPVAPPEQDAVQAKLDAAGSRVIREEHDGKATVAAYSIVHGRDGAPEWGVVVCDVGEGERAYGKVVAPEALAGAEDEELVGRTVQLTPQTVSLPTGAEATQNIATL